MLVISYLFPSFSSTPNSSSQFHIFSHFSDDPFGDPKAIGDPYSTLFVGHLSHLTTEHTLQKVTFSGFFFFLNLRSCELFFRISLDLKVASFLFFKLLCCSWLFAYCLIGVVAYFGLCLFAGNEQVWKGEELKNC